MPIDTLINSATGNTIIKSNVNMIGKMVINEQENTTAANGGTLRINHSVAGGTSSIRFGSTINDYGGDYGYIQYSDNRDGGTALTNENSLLTIGTANDADPPVYADDIKIAPSGSLEITGNTNITNTRVSSSTTTGALTVGGGVGIAGNVYVGGNIRITKDTQSTDNATGALVVTGGVGILSRLNVAGDVKLSTANPSTSTATGALTVNGGVGVGGDMFVGGNIRITKETPSNDNATGALVVSGGVGLLSRLNVAGDVKLSNGTPSTSTATGALTVNGGVGVLGDMFVGGNIRMAKDTQSSSTATGAFTVVGGVGIGGALNIGGKMVITEPTSTTGAGGGTLLIQHGTSGGSSSIRFDSTVNRSTINGDGGDYAYIQYDDNRGSGENALLTIGTSNDADDDIKIAPTGSLEITSVTKITNDTQSSSTTTGSLIVSGGVGIAKQLNVGGTSSFNGPISTNNNNIDIGSGGLVLRGGGRISDDGNELTITSDTNIDIAGKLRVYTTTGKGTSGEIDCGTVFCRSINDSESTSTGALIVNGGVGIAKKLYVGGSANIGGKMVISEPTSTTGAQGGTLLIQHGTSGGSSSIRFDSTINRGGGDYAYIQYDDNRGSGENALLTIGTSNDADDDIKIAPTGSLEITSVTKITNDTQSNSNSTGALVVNGGVGIAKDLYVEGSIISRSITPAGSVIAFLGPDDPTGWVIANGTLRNNNSDRRYNNLSAMLIGTGGSGTSNYTPPDYRGAFFRGAGTSSVNTGYAGPAIKTSQNHATQTHTHGIVLHAYGSNSSVNNTTVTMQGTYNHPSGGYGDAATIYDSGNTIISGVNRYTDGNETRPFNFGVNWIIKL